MAVTPANKIVRGGDLQTVGAEIRDFVLSHYTNITAVSSQQDGTIVITLASGDTVTVDLNHVHPQYLKYVLCSDEAEYTAITDKQSDTLYLIPES